MALVSGILTLTVCSLGYSLDLAIVLRLDHGSHCANLSGLLAGWQLAGGGLIIYTIYLHVYRYRLEQKYLCLLLVESCIGGGLNDPEGPSTPNMVVQGPQSPL